MPANLTPQYLSAEQRFKEAATAQEKIAALEEMMAVIPKHKGTEKMRAALKQKMAKLRTEKGKKHGVSKASAIYAVHREGAGQVALVGAPNVGKSALLAKLTHATPEVADYAFTTQLPQPGMMPFEDIQIQLVDLPPVAREYYKPWMGGLVRQADLALLVVDLGSDEVLDQAEDVIGIMEESRIRLASEVAAPGPEEEPDQGVKRTLLVANKADLDQGGVNLGILKEFFRQRFDILPVSAVTGQGLEEFRVEVFGRLEVVRVYTKAPGKKVDPGTPPFVLKSGSTVIDLARAVHQDFVNSLKFAKIWTSDRSKGSVKFDGQLVERTHCLEDGDILELHA